VRALHGLTSYGWAFNAFFITSVTGIVTAGAQADRSGPTRPFLLGLATFVVGLVVAGTAADMVVFVLGRAIQGFGAGSVVVAAYVLVARSYADSLRPPVFAVMSAAWVLPALVGPPVAGVVAEQLSWRWVFLGLPPLVVLGVLLLLPALRKVPRQSAATVPSRRVWIGVELALGAAAVQAAGEQWRWTSLPLLVVGAALLVRPAGRLLPAGTLRARGRLPTGIALRGLLAGSFFGAEAFLPLELVTVHHSAPTGAGVPLTVGALGWSAASWWQGRRPPGRAREPLVRAGFSLVAIGVLSLVALAATATPALFALPCWLVAGAGMGLAMPTVSVLVLGWAAPSEQGFTSAALQICDVLGSVFGVAIGATVLAAVRAHAGHVGTAVAVTDVLMAVGGTWGAVLAGRLYRFRSDPR
jgi:MFS family permease